MLTMYKQITIKTLHKQGLKQAAIAEQLGCHRHTIANVLQRKQIIEKQVRTKGSVFDPHKERIKEWMKQDVSILRQFEVLTQTYGVHSTYVNLCKYIQVRFPKQKEAFGVQVVAPGEVAEIDFGEIIVTVSGKKTKLFVLAVILPYSRMGYYGITENQKLVALCQELEKAFAYFGGVPKKLKVDNMKTAVITNRRYELEFNQDFLDFAYQYGFVITPCTPYSPEQKGTVEAGIKYVQTNFAAARACTDTADVSKQLDAWMRTTANQRIHGTTRRIPADMFLKEEKTALQSLPEHPFAFFNRCMRKVALNCHIHFENNYYSVPSNCIGKTVTVRFNAHLVRIILESEQVALHTRSYAQGTYITERSHLPAHKLYSETEQQARSEEQMCTIGEYAQEYFKMLLEKRHSYWFRTVRIMVGFAQEYGKEAVNLSLQRALYYHVMDVPTIKNILEKKLYLLETEPVMPKTDQKAHPMARDLTYYTAYAPNTVSITA